MRSLKASLIITTYERPDALDAVLQSVARQRELPGEIIVADDGSGEITAQVIRAWRSRLSVPLHHCRQDKQGFRLTRLRNLAILAARGDYLIFIDGDMVLHPEFVADHILLARRGCFTQGVRLLMSPQRTALQLAHPLAMPKIWSRGLGGLRRLYLIHNRTIARGLRALGNQLIAIKGCNQAFWRTDLVQANGFEELIEGWGPEDKELCARLCNSGLQRQSLIAGGIAFHLHHPQASRAALSRNLELLERTLRTGRQRSERGLAEHQVPPC